MADVTGDLRIVLNGEIYNYRELREELLRSGHSFASGSDTEVVLEAFKRWGTGCLAKLNGMFAFGIYSARRRELFIARDRAGEKPLFYVHRDGVLRFCSELKALLADPEFPRAIDPLALDHYLAYGYVPGELCILSGIKKLPPAHALLYHVETDTLRTWRYWSLPLPVSNEGKTPDDLAAELEELLTDAVRRQTVADVPVGILLSGGLDSSLITALAAKSSGSPVKTFTISFPGHGVYDESAHARLVADFCGTEHTELVAEPTTVDLLPTLAKQYDEPLGDSSMIPTYLVSRLVRQNCTVALGGDGGDELFGGYVQYSRMQAVEKLRKLLPTPITSLAGRIASALPVGVRGRTYLQSLGLESARAWTSATLLLDLDTRRRLAPMTRSLGAFPESYRSQVVDDRESLLQKMTAADFHTYLPDDILVKVDRASMLASLEIRAPFLDFRVVEFAFGRVPDYLRATSRSRKVLLGQLAKKVLPRSFDVTRKRGFGIPLDAWFKGAWGPFISDVLRQAPSDLFDQNEISRLLGAQNKGLSNGQRLFNLAFLELWRRAYSVSI